MSAVLATAARVVTRDATAKDNAALIALAAACPMAGDLSLCVNRAPDFFALNRLEGDRWSVGVADLAGSPTIGCVAVAERCAHVFGHPSRVMYASDLKVHPDHRGSRAADALILYVRDHCLAAGGPDVPILLTVLAGNRPMERLAEGPRGLPVLSHFATLRAHAVPLLWRRRVPDAGVRFTTGRESDLEDMAALWRTVAPGRQFAPAFDADGLERWITDAPGLDLSDYIIARRPNGRLAGFLGVWDQTSFKQLRVVAYSRRLAVVRAALNAAAPVIGVTPLPSPGAPLRHATVVHACVPPRSPEVLRALVLTAYDALRGRGHAFFTIGLDVRDPLANALDGLLAQPTDISARVTTPLGSYTGPALDDRPLHFEIALV